MIPPELCEPIQKKAYVAARNNAYHCKHGVTKLEAIAAYRAGAVNKRFPNRIFEIVYCADCNALKFSKSLTGEPEDRKFVHEFPGQINWDGKDL